MPATTATDLHLAAERFHALSDPTRLRIIGMLGGGERCVCELMAELDAAQSRLSFHLRVLREAGFVTARRDEQWIYYSLQPEIIAELVATLTMPRQEWKRAARCC
ncbi:MAG TPA: metalloregulator ArsR/SmtB family transcription factor [Gemmatimonadales bacterium]|jgi:ArsR family transcriptional regulator|nr:metalloregulator ArsR/SmtB family transcription factor [Gemmatimonadales bacterium]